MKARILLMLIFSVITITSFSQATRKGSRAAAEEFRKSQVEALINSRTFVFHARMAIPSAGKSVDLTTYRSYVSFSPDLIESSLPFFGRAYSGVGYGNDTGMHFSGSPEDFLVQKKNKNYQINTSVQGEQDHYRLTLTISYGGTASLTITSNNRESISYTGDITPPDKKK
jgi:hypothetical protein